MSLGKKLKELRAEREWTQSEVAKRSGLERGYLANLEIDGVAKPSATTFLKLARAFNINERELYQAAGYIKNTKTAYQYKETSEDILERLRLAHPVSIPIYDEFPFHAGESVEPVDYVYRARPKTASKSIEGYLVHGKCLEPVVEDGDIVIVNREAEIENGDIVAALVNDEIHIARLRKIADELYLENNHSRFKFEECQVAAPVIEVIRRLK